MRGISEERIIEKLRESYKSTELIYESDCLNNLFKNECQELQEPWIPIDEFLKSGFEGLCLVSIESYVILSERTNYGFFGTGGIMFDISSITHVMPIHKPEPPR